MVNNPKTTQNTIKINLNFVEKLIQDKQDLSIPFDLILQNITPLNATNLEKRAAYTFSLIALAGELAITYRLLPWKRGSVIEGSKLAFKRWQRLLGAAKTEDHLILGAINDFIAKYGDSRFSTLDDPENKSIHNRAGWYKNTAQGRTYLFFPVSLVEAGKGYERSRIVDALRKAKWIIETDHGRMTKKVRTNAGLKNLYHVAIKEESE